MPDIINFNVLGAGDFDISVNLLSFVLGLRVLGNSLILLVLLLSVVRWDQNSV